MMSLNEIAKAIGVVKYDNIPEGMFRYYPIPENRKAELCSMEMIDRLQERFDFFGEYYEAAKKSWAAIEQDENRKTWVDVSSLYMIDEEYEKVTKIPVPDPDGTPAGDLLQLFIHVPAVEAAYDGYIKRGFSEEFALKYMRRYYGNVSHTSKNIIGRPSLIAMYFRWLCLYTKTRIFDHLGFNFELHRYSLGHILKNKKTGEILPVSIPQTMHKSGLPLGSAGCEDTDGSFETTFEETEEAYIGYPAKNGKYFNEIKTFPKSEWEEIMKPGDTCIGIHIPRGADVSPENFSAALAGAKEIVERGYGDWSPKMFCCSSWLLSYELEEMLKPDSKILSFGRCFVRYPRKDKGRSVFSFVFPQSFKGPLEELPEDTSLMRSIKAKYIAGEFVHDYSGVIEL